MLLFVVVVWVVAFVVYEILGRISFVFFPESLLFLFMVKVGERGGFDAVKGDPVLSNLQ